tara:strand:+ start:239 stop:589 length:351 start_codon:yes stop_codon:yes gene_type:complete
MPKVASVNCSSSNHTCYQGELKASFERLVNEFGPPTSGPDNYKVDAEWVIEFEGGYIATIYNWKDGKNYLGEDGLELDQITDWHIGGKSKRVVGWLDDLINNSWPIFDEIRQESQF